MERASACVQLVVNPEWSREPRVKNLMGQEAGLQEKEKLKGMKSSASVLCKCEGMINDPHLVNTDCG